MRSSEVSITVQPNGDLRMIYYDEIATLLTCGESRIVRASHVEPAAQGWTADMSPVDGPTLGPFALRQDALDAEVEWLSRRLER